MPEETEIQTGAEQESQSGEETPTLTSAEQALATAWEAADAKAAQLSANPTGRKVLPLILQGDSDTDYVIGYMYEMDGLTDAKVAASKLSGFDSSFPKALQALESLILFDQSDSRLRQKKYMNGAALYLLSLVEIATPILKKK